MMEKENNLKESRKQMKDLNVDRNAENKFPVSFQDFIKYTNISKIVAEDIKRNKKHLAEQYLGDKAYLERMAHKCYLNFYIKHKYRKIPPLIHVKVKKKCPSHIKQLIFDIPKQLRKKHTIRNVEGNKKDPLGTDANGDGCHVWEVNESRSLKDDASYKPSHPVEASFKASLAIPMPKPPSIKQFIKCVDFEEDFQVYIKQNSQNDPSQNEEQVRKEDELMFYKKIYTSLEVEDHRKERFLTETPLESVKNADTVSPINSTVNSSFAISNLESKSNSNFDYPVSFDTFKTYTFYEEIVDEIFDRIPHNSKYSAELRSDEDKKNRILYNFYQAFYRSTEFRKKYKIRLKKCPNHLRELILKIPDKLTNPKSDGAKDELMGRKCTSIDTDNVQTSKCKRLKTILEDNSFSVEQILNQDPENIGLPEEKQICEHAQENIALPEEQQDSEQEQENIVLPKHEVEKTFILQNTIAKCVDKRLEVIFERKRKLVLERVNELILRHSVPTTEANKILDYEIENESEHINTNPKGTIIEKSEEIRNAQSGGNPKENNCPAEIIVCSIDEIYGSDFMKNCFSGSIDRPKEATFCAEHETDQFENSRNSANSELQSIEFRKPYDRSSHIVLSKKESIKQNSEYIESMNSPFKANNGVLHRRERFADYNDLLKKKFFIYADKNFTLAYAVRHSRGLKRRIIRAFMKMNVEEFSKYTRIRDCARNIYQDRELLDKCFEYVMVNQKTWPPVLYMRHQDIKEYLCTKGFVRDSLNLEDIPPKFFDWEELAMTTNFDKIVIRDYFRETGKKLNNDFLSERRENFYDRCWAENEWLWGVPKLFETTGKSSSEVHLSQNFLTSKEVYNCLSSIDDDADDTETVLFPLSSSSMLKNDTIRQEEISSAMNNENGNLRRFEGEIEEGLDHSSANTINFNYCFIDPPSNVNETKTSFTSDQSMSKSLILEVKNPPCIGNDDNQAGINFLQIDGKYLKSGGYNSNGTEIHSSQAHTNNRVFPSKIREIESNLIVADGNDGVIIADPIEDDLRKIHGITKIKEESIKFLHNLQFVEENTLDEIKADSIISQAITINDYTEEENESSRQDKIDRFMIPQLHQQSSSFMELLPVKYKTNSISNPSVEDICKAFAEVEHELHSDMLAIESQYHELVKDNKDVDALNTSESNISPKVSLEGEICMKNDPVNKITSDTINSSGKFVKPSGSRGRSKRLRGDRKGANHMLLKEDTRGKNISDHLVPQLTHVFRSLPIIKIKRLSSSSKKRGSPSI